MGEIVKITEVLDFESGGSGTGVSYYKTAMNCPRRARLQKEKREAGEVKHDYDGFAAADKGTVFHRLAEIYHNKDTETVIDVADAAGQPALQEGTAMFASYSKHFGVEAWGQVLGCEVSLPGDCEPDCPYAEAENKTACECGRADNEQRLRKLFQVPFTCRIDMVVLVRESDVAGIKERTGLELEPGIYLLDHKTKDRKDSKMHQKYADEVQFHAYMMAWNACFPEMPCKGLIVNVVINHKKMTKNSHAAVLVDTPTETQQQAVLTFLNNAAVLAKTDMPNILHCHDYSGCPFLHKECDRT